MSSTESPVRIKPVWIVALATLIACGMRFLLIDRLPPQIWFDEVWFSWKARQLLQFGEFAVYYKTYWGGVHPMFVVLTALANVLGVTGALAPRIVSALAGVASVPMAYVCLREFLRGEFADPQRDWIAAIIALALAPLTSFVIVARVGLEWSLAAMFTLTAVWLFHRAQRLRAWPLWLALGVTLGAAQYLSQHMRFLAPLIALFTLHDVWVKRDKRVLMGALLAAAVSAAVAGPLLLFFAREPQWLTARANIIVNTGEQTRLQFFLNNAWLVACSLFVDGSGSTLDNVPGRALLDVLQMIGFGAGLAWALMRVTRSSASRKLLAWIPVMAAPTILTEGAPSFERMVGAVPAIVALAVIGWWWMGRWLAARLRQPQAVRAGAAILASASLALNAQAVFVAYPSAPKLRADFTAGITELMNELVTRSHTEAVFAGRLLEATNTPHQDFLLPGTPVNYLDFRQCMPFTHERATRTSYLVNSGGDPGALETLKRVYPQATVTPYLSESTWLVQDLTLVEVSANTRAALPMTAQRAVFSPGMTLLGYTLQPEHVKPGESVFITLYWQTQREMPADYTSFLHVDSNNTAAPVLTQRDGQPCQGFYPTSRWKPGDVVPDSFAITIPADAAPGKHALRIGWYAFPSLERQMLLDAGPDDNDNRAWIAELTIDN